MSVEVSVIIPNFNHAAYLDERIESVLNQDFDSFEVIVLDDNSTDNSLDIIQSFANHKKISQVIVNKQNSGSTFKQWQKGVELAQGRFIWIAESDDIAHESFLSTMVSISQADETITLAYCQSDEIDHQGTVIGDYFRYTDDLDAQLWYDRFKLAGEYFVVSYLTKRNCIPNVSAILFRKRAFQQLDQAVTQCRYLGDWLFYIKALKGNSIAYTPDKLNKFRTHGLTTRSGKTLEDWQAIKNEFYRVFDEIKLSFNWQAQAYSNACQEVETLLQKLVAVVPLLQNHIKDGKISKTLAIYGAGSLGVFIANLISRVFPSTELEISCFIDQKATKAHGSMLLLGKPVVSIETFKKTKANTPVFIASIAFYQEMKSQLINAGLHDLLIESGSN